MDAVVEEIATFVSELDFDNIPDELCRAATTRIVDSIGCALAAIDAPTAIAADRLQVVDSSSVTGGRAIGYKASGRSVDLAGFINTARIRDLDFNDWSPNGHPSDCLGGILALSDVAQLSGRDLIGATNVAYEIYIRLMDRSRMTYLGWDQGFSTGIATAAAVGKLLKLTVPELGDAISIMAASGVPTRSTRLGEIAMWKGCATAFAVRNSLFAASLAKSGVTGPSEAFEGKHGIFDLITGPFTLDFPTTWNSEFCITRSTLKYWPFGYYAQVPGAAALKLREVAPNWEELETIEVFSHNETLNVTADGPTKWNPQTAQTADHSTPYVVARLLRDGTITPDAFEPEGFLDPSLRPLMAKISVKVSDEAVSLFPDTIMATIIAKDRNGATFVVEERNPKGHPDNPLTESELYEKFVRLASSICKDNTRIDATFEAWNSIGNADSLGAALDLCADLRTAR